jgi:hypothetical protein
MGNNTTDSKLDETVKKSLDSYEANYDAADWSRMERMLDAAPKSSASKSSYNIAVIIGAVVLAGSFFIYKGITSPKSTTGPTAPEQATEMVTAPVEKKTTTVKTTPAPAAKTIPAETAVVNSQPVAIPEAKPAVVPEAKTVIATTDKTKAVKKSKTNEADADFPKNQKVTVMGNEPIFGDMIDSSKGIIRETKEKESTKKAAKSKGTSNIGLSGLMYLNADSIKKQKELMQKDTLHK